MKVIVIGKKKEDGSQSDEFLLHEDDSIMAFEDLDGAMFFMKTMGAFTEQEILEQLNFYEVEKENLKGL